MYYWFGHTNLTVIERLITVQHKIILDVVICSYMLEVDCQTNYRAIY